MPGPPLNRRGQAATVGARGSGSTPPAEWTCGASLLQGVADDGGGVKAVSIAMARVQRHGCRWLVAKPRRLARQAGSCARPRWIAATISGRRWSVRMSS